MITDAEKFAMTEYAAALAAGNTLEPPRRKAVLDKLHHFTGLPVAYLDKANLRVTAGEFAKTLQDDADLTTGWLDSRFSGPTMDPLGKTAGYDPQAAAISSAYLSAYNDYARTQLGVTADKVYRPRKLMEWIWKHESPRRIQHLPIPARLQSNLEMKFYPSGHMIYASEPSLHTLHDNIAALVKRTSTVKPK